MSKETITLDTLLSGLLGMVHERWERDNLEGYINDLLGFEGEYYINPQFKTPDKALSFDLMLEEDKLVFITLFYLLDNDNNMLITEIYYDSEAPTSDVKILGRVE